MRISKFVLGAVLGIATPAHAYDCFPSTWVPTPGVGTPYRSTETEVAKAKAWWCLLPARQGDLADTYYWAPQIFVYLKKYESLSDLSAAALRVGAATNPLDQLNAEVKAATVVPPPGSEDEYQFKLMGYTACKDLEVNPPKDVVFSPSTTPDWCGLAPTPPTGEVWWVMKASLAAVPAGTRPTYVIKNGTLSLECLTCRVPEYSICVMEEPKRKINTTYFGLVLGTTGRYAVCVKKP